MVSTYFLWLLGKLLSTAASLLSPIVRTDSPSSCLLIEAGVAGWAEPAPGLLEIEQSAKEYLTGGVVSRVEIPKPPNSYIRAVFRAVSGIRPTHYFYDTRSGSQHPFWGSIQALVVVTILAWYGVTPLTILTNFPARRWRRQVSAVTSNSGLVLTLIQPGATKGWIPHSRVIGPIFMPFSEASLRRIRKGRRNEWNEGEALSVSFIGTVYEPRKSELDRIEKVLQRLNVRFVRHERSPQTPKITQRKYWQTLREARVLITTADHIEKEGADPGFPQHMVYRYTEALVAETCLLAPDLGGSLIPGKHFVPFDGADTLEISIRKFLSDKARIETISHDGAAFIERRIMEKAWWKEVDEALAYSGQRQLRENC